MQFSAAMASHEANRDAFSTTVTSYNPSRYEDVKPRNTNPANSATEYSSTISQYGEFYGIKKKPLALYKKKSSGSGVKKISSGYERDPLFMTQEQRVAKKEEDQYWPEYFRQKERNFLSTRAGGSDPRKNQSSGSTTNNIESGSKLSPKTAKSKKSNIFVDAQSLALKEQTKCHTYQFAVTFDEWEAKKKKEIAKKKAIAARRKAKKIEMEKKEKAKKKEEEAKSFNEWKTKYDKKRRQELLDQKAKEKEEKENELRRKEQNRRDHERMMRKVKRDRLVMIMTKKDIETKEKKKNIETTNYLLASRAKLISDTPSEIELWKKRKKREAIERRKQEREQARKEKLLKEKQRREKWKKKDIVLAYARQ